MISRELARKIRYIQIHTKKAVNDVLAGHYHSVFKGRGMEFDQVREYTPGDDVRSIDWNVTARTGKPYVKRFVEERELTVIFLVDCSGSGRFGTSGAFKNEIAAELCALMAFSAIRNNDKVGLVAFSDRTELYIPPKKGTTHVLRVIREVLCLKPEGHGTDISRALDFFGQVTKKRVVVFLISDFFDEGFERQMRVLSRRHDLIAMSLADPRELALPDVGLLELEDAETGASHLIDTGSAAVRTRFELAAAGRLAALQKTCDSMGVDHIQVRTGDDYVKDLVRFFRKREKKAAWG